MSRITKKLTITIDSDYYDYFEYLQKEKKFNKSAYVSRLIMNGIQGCDEDRLMYDKYVMEHTNLLNFKENRKIKK